MATPSDAIRASVLHLPCATFQSGIHVVDLDRAKTCQSQEPGPRPTFENLGSYVGQSRGTLGICRNMHQYMYICIINYVYVYIYNITIWYMCVYHCFSEILLFESLRSFLGPLSCLPKSFLLAKHVDTPQNMHRIVF